MKKDRRLILCDRDEKYAWGLANYISRKKNNPFELFVFTGLENFRNYISKEEADVLLISDEALSTVGAGFIEGRGIRETLVLSEDGRESEVCGHSAIFKYQSGEKIMKKVLECYADADEEITVSSMRNTKTKLIAVYSPVRRTLKTSFAMTMGQILSEKKSVLYINLEDYAGFNSLLKTSYATDMSDLIYYISQHKPNFIWKVSSMVQSIGGLDYIPPALSPMDIKSVTEEQWLGFLDELEKCAYEVIILDLGDSVRGIYKILRRCCRIYTPTRDDGISYAKMEQYEALLKVMKYDDILENSRKLSFSYFKGLERGLDRLVYSELGQYVRALLKEDGVLA